MIQFMNWRVRGKRLFYSIASMADPERVVEAEVEIDGLEYVEAGVRIIRGDAEMILATQDYNNTELVLVSDVPSRFRADGFYSAARALVSDDEITTGGALICGIDRWAYDIHDNISACYQCLIEPDSSPFFVRGWLCFRYLRASYKLWPLVPEAEYTEETWKAILRFPIDVFLDIMNGRLNPLDDQSRKTMFAIGLI